MNSRKTGILCLLLAGTFAAAAAFGQKATEQYIPIGESPGVSGTESIIGTIAGLDHDRYRMAVRDGDELRTVEMTPSTRYYLDRTGRKASNRLIGFDACEAGQRVEIKLNDDGTADWVKVETR